MFFFNFENKRILIDPDTGREYRLLLEKGGADTVFATFELYESTFWRKLLVGKLLIIRLLLDKNTDGNDPALESGNGNGSGTDVNRIGACHCAFIADVTFSPEVLHEVLVDFLSIISREYKISFAVFLCPTKYFRVCIPVFCIDTGQSIDTKEISTKVPLVDIKWKTVKAEREHTKLFNSQMLEETFFIIETSCQEALMSEDENIMVLRERDKFFYVGFKNKEDETSAMMTKIANTLPKDKVIMVPDYLFSSEMKISDKYPTQYQVKYPCHSLGEIRKLRLPLL